MKVISSVTNEQIIIDSKLKSKKYRDERNQFIIEGKKIIREAIDSGHILSCLYFTKNNDITGIVANEYIEVSQNVLAKLTDATTPQGIVAVVNKKDTNIDNTFKRALILENVQDPKNVGSLIRTGIATNFVDIYLINCADPYSMKSIRASMGTLFKGNIYNVTLEEALSKLKDYDIIVADMNGENLFSATLPTINIAIAVGNEGQGVTNELKEKANRIISIPMNNNVESLNVTVSGSIIMYNIIKEE